MPVDRNTEADRAPGRSGKPLALLRIQAMADQGMTLARLDGKAVFVPFGAPGDLAEVELVREKPRYAEGRIVRLVEPSPLRRDPPCPSFGTCGGCQWQHLPYAAQLEAKDRSFRGFFEGRLGLGPERFRPPIAAPSEWGYRNRVGLKVRGAGGEVAVGFYAHGTHRLVPVVSCPVARPEIQGVLEPLRRFLAAFAPARNSLPQVDLQVDGSGGLWAVFHLLRPLVPAETDALRGFVAGQGLAGAFLQSGRKATLAPVGRSAPLLRFPIEAAGRLLSLGLSPGGFVQANPQVNRALLAEVLDLAPLYRSRPGLDLYCGAGNFTLPLALEASQVVGVEGFPPAARDAARNAAANGLRNVRVLSMSAEEGIRTLAAEGFRPGFALLDPPREGAFEAVRLLGGLGAEHILYVSCSPPTLARDLGILLGDGYRVEWARTADMFPQTSHLESLALLGRAP